MVEHNRQSQAQTILRREEKIVSINIEIWLTIKIIIMRKLPHPVVTYSHYNIKLFLNLLLLTL